MATRYPIPPGVLRLSSVEDRSLPLDAALEPTDEAIALLMLVAEVEHAFLLQYLYGAYSVRIGHPDWGHQLTAEVAAIRSCMIELAREEMGHLMTVQNLLIAMGARLHFARDPQSEHYPLRFRLERLSLDSLAKYLCAERPESRPPEMPEAEWARLPEIEERARVANGGAPVGHLDRILRRLVELLATEVPDHVFYPDTEERQARWQDWGYDSGLYDDDRGRRVHVEAADGGMPAETRARAVDALRAITGQGEGAEGQRDSHFHRLIRLYVQVEELESRGVQWTWPVADDPTTDSEPSGPGSGESAGAAGTPVRAARARAWALLGDLRYRALLGHVMHYLSLDGPRYIEDGVGVGDRTPRGLLLAWAFEEMQNLRRIAGKLVQMPADQSGGVHAGLPFRPPVALMTGTRESARWHAHLDVSLCTLRLLDEQLLGPIDDAERDPTDPAGPAHSIDRDDPFLLDLRRLESERVLIARALAGGQPIPDEVRPQGFAKVGQILEQAIRGADIGVHRRFWTDIGRDQFVDLHLFGLPLVGREPLNRCYLSPEESSLIWMLQPQHLDGREKATSERMPRYRPAMPPSRLQFLRTWIARQAPDSTPPATTRAVRDPRPESSVVEPSVAAASATPDESSGETDDGPADV